MDSTMADYSSMEKGCLDDTLAVFERHNHSFVVVGVVSMQWSSSNPMPHHEIDLLLQPSAIEAITNDLTASEWTLSENPYLLESRHGSGSTYKNTTTTPDIWLKHRGEGYFHPLGFTHLRLWPETLYHLSTACRKFEIPDILPLQRVTFGDEYYRDPHGRFGPRRYSALEALSEPITRSPSH